MAVSTSWLHLAAVLSTLLALAHCADSFPNTTSGSYVLQDNYTSNNFFEGFDFFSGPDPTRGFVKYHSAVQANSQSLAGFANGAVYLGVDHETMDPARPGRGSVRLSSKNSFTKGLFIADIAHMPENKCGVWPAFWTFGPNWPSSGEIDIIEGVNTAKTVTSTLHTSEGCSFRQGNCEGNQGCGQESKDTKTYGAGFNAIGGGIYAMEWQSESIKIFFFPRTGTIPEDIDSDSPNTASWPAPQAEFAGSGCNIDQHFKNHQIVFNTAFCGDWAGKVFSEDPVCSKLAPTCDEYVASNPGEFKEAYWSINSVKVFKKSSLKRATRSFQA